LDVDAVSVVYFITAKTSAVDPVFTPPVGADFFVSRDDIYQFTFITTGFFHGGIRAYLFSNGIQADLLRKGIRTGIIRNGILLGRDRRRQQQKSGNSACM
jgi:hypothetical protein